MYGVILGDMIGAPYEFDRGNKTKNFPLFSRGTEFTDDSVITIAVADALMDTIGRTDDDIRAAVIRSMQKWGRRYPEAGYGCMFYNWLRQRDPKPYGSFGNGSAMRVSSTGWLFDTLEETRKMARLTAEVTHNHPEGIKGAEATASAIFIARNGSAKEEIREYIVTEFGYDLSRTCEEIRPGYHHVETCQQTVPEAITAFLEGTCFEDVIRTAVSLGGDCDTLTCIAGAIAEAFYGVPEDMKAECRKRLPKDMLEVLERFEERKVVMTASECKGMSDNSYTRRAQIPILKGRFIYLTEQYEPDDASEYYMLHKPGHFRIYNQTSCVMDAKYEKFPIPEDAPADKIIAVIVEFAFSRDKFTEDAFDLLSWLIRKGL